MIIKDPTTNLWHLIQAHRSNEAADIRFLFKVRLMFDMSELKETINELDSIVASFSRFVNIVLINRIPVEHDVSRKSMKLGKFLRNIRRLAIDLHTALTQSWKPGCHDQHKVGISLEDRVDGLSALSFGGARLLTSTSIFQLRLASEPMDGPFAWFEAPCQITKELVYLDSSDDSSQQRSGVTFVIPPQMRDSASLSASTAVDDMCAFLDSIQGGDNHVNLLLTNGPKIISTQAIAQGLRCHTHADTLPLESFLGDRSILTLKIRMALALQLASSFLQFAQTGWMRSYWTKATVHFLQLKATAVPCVDLSHALILSDFGSVPRTLETDSVDPIVQHDQAALVELGIILLELWHNQTLESRFPLAQSSESYSRWTSALEWLKDADQPPPLYDKAVCHCIRGVFGNESRFTGHTDPKFWTAFCNDVIQPLYDNCKQWRHA